MRDSESLIPSAIRPINERFRDPGRLAQARRHIPNRIVVVRSPHIWAIRIGIVLLGLGAIIAGTVEIINHHDYGGIVVVTFWAFWLLLFIYGWRKADQA